MWGQDLEKAFFFSFHNTAISLLGVNEYLFFFGDKRG